MKKQLRIIKIEDTEHNVKGRELWDRYIRTKKELGSAELERYQFWNYIMIDYPDLKESNWEVHFFGRFIEFTEINE